MEAEEKGTRYLHVASPSFYVLQRQEFICLNFLLLCFV